MSSQGRSRKGNEAGGSDSGAIGGIPVVVTNVTVEPESSFPGQSCRVCRTVDTDSMVRCDRCLKWFHFTCVGVTQAIEDEPWSCEACTKSMLVPEGSLNRSNGGVPTGGVKKKQAAGHDSDKLNLPAHQEPGDLLTPKTSKACKVGSQVKPKADGKKTAAKEKLKTSEQRPTDQKELKKPSGLQAEGFDKNPSKAGNKPSAKGSNQALPTETDKNLPISIGKAKSVVSHVSSRASSRSSQSLVKLKLQKLEEERILNAKKMEQERVYLEEKYRLLEAMASEDGSNTNSESDVVRRWLPQAQSSHHSQPEDQGSVAQESLHPVADQFSNHRSRALIDGPRNVLEEIRREGPPYVGRLPEREEDFFPLTKKQLAARQAVAKDLPQFSGNPEDWPLFVATFNNTTAMCGFSNDENIFRLQKSLKGRAFEAVKSRLVHPSNVPGILKTLKMMFGQPEAIVHTLIEKIHTLPAIREDKLETLVDFAVSVENFCATVDACGLDEYLYNTSLLHQLVSKLPPTIKLNWAQYRISIPGVNLAAFSIWMYSLAEAASTVIIPETTNEKTIRSERKKGHAFVNAHSGNASPVPPATKPSSWKNRSAC